MSKKEIIISQVEKKYCLPEKRDEFSFRRDEYILIESIEKEYLKSAQPERDHFEEILRGKYWSRDFEKEDIENYLTALSNDNTDERKRILLKTAAKFEKAGRLVWAAEEYFEAGEMKKAIEVLIKRGHEPSSEGEEFLWAADCLIQGGTDKKQAHLSMSEEFKKMMAEKRAQEHSWTRIYNNFGECLHRAGEKEEALKAFMQGQFRKDDKLEAGRDYLARIEEWERAAEFQKKLIDKNYYGYWRDDNLKLAEYYHKAGLKKEEAQALWQAGNYLEAARIASEITKNKKYFLKAAEQYSKIRPRKQAYFVNKVWNWFDEGCLNVCYDSSIEENKKEQLNRIHELLTSVFSAYSLPLPPKISSEPGETKESHKEIATKLYDEFQEKKKTAKQAQIRTILSSFSFIEALEHAILADISLYKFKDFFREAFKGTTCPRPIESNLTPEAKKLWEEAAKEEINMLGYDPVEMAGRAYEEGGYYKQAKERYLKAGLLDDAERMETKVKLEEL